MVVARVVNLLLAAVAVTAPAAHVLELPNKLALDGPLWLAVQQQLYQGWGAVFGPVEIAALATSIALLALRRGHGAAARFTWVAVAAQALMLVVFFVFNNPVNVAFSSWTVATLPPDWPDYRLRWEIGHALAAVLAVTALLALIAAWRRDTPP